MGYMVKFLKTNKNNIKLTERIYMKKREAEIDNGIGRQDKMAKDEVIRFDKKGKHWFEIAHVLYLEAAGNYIIVHTTQDQYIISKTLKFWEKQMDESRFWRVHKSYLVNVEHIKELQGEVLLDMGQYIPIGRKYRQEIKEKYIKVLEKKIREQKNVLS